MDVEVAALQGIQHPREDTVSCHLTANALISKLTDCARKSNEPCKPLG